MESLYGPTFVAKVYCPTMDHYRKTINLQVWLKLNYKNNWTRCKQFPKLLTK